MDIELLAPAKNLECGIAAIDHGADAVYVGASSFGARKAAGNSVEDIASLCRYAHQFGVKVYGTVNTIILDNEMDEAVSLVRQLEKAGIDAILIQDFGLLSRIVRENITLPIHASTQTDNRTVDKVKWLRKQGFSRAVLARELTLNEIREIHNSVPDMELEVFVHGALCVSYSGQCYASQYCFGRSANKGECAQLCRMKYHLTDATGADVDDAAYYLSLKDQCQIDNLQAIIDAGACSLKIEGRLKDIAYVKNVVAAYSRKLDSIVAKSNGKYRRQSWGRVNTSFEPDLNRSFNRGYTDYFLHGRHQGIASLLTPKAIGEYVGKVKSMTHNSIVVAGTASFVNGDGLCFMTQNGELDGFRVNKAVGNRLYPLQMPRGVKVGTLLYRSQDHAFDKMMSGKTSTRLIPIDLSLSMADVNELTLEIKGVGCPVRGKATIHMDEIQEAQKPQKENMERQLSKFGGTVYTVHNIHIAKDVERLFIPSSKITELRRLAVEDIHTIEEATAARTMVLDASDVECDKYHKEFTYLYNASNDEAKEYYSPVPTSAFEVKRPYGRSLVMQCKHCIRYTMGYCIKNGGVRPQWQEPLSLRLDDGRVFSLEFDCRNCQMNVYTE